MESAFPGVALSNIINPLVEAIKDARKTAKRFKPLLSHLKDTVNWIIPRVNEISRSTNSHEIDSLLIHLNRAKELVDKCSTVSSWRIYKKYNFTKEMIEVDNSIRTTLEVFFPVMIYEDTRKILDSVDELKMMFSIFFYIMLDDFQSGAKNTAGSIFDVIRSKGSFQSLGFDKIVNSQPAEIVNDIALWKRKKISGSLLASSTATWFFQKVSERNFVSILSWIAIIVITSVFIWRHVQRFLDQEEAARSRLERLREQVAMETANACWEVTDKLSKWILHVTDVEGNWSVFPQTVAMLLLFSYAGSFFDLPTLRNFVMMGTSIPVMLANHADRIKPLGSMVGKVYEMLTDTIKNNVRNEEIKKKKLKKQY